jgi:MFS family permease
MIAAEPVSRDRADPRALLSALWVFAMFNYLYADVMSLMDPILLPQFVQGRVGSIAMTRPFLLGAAVMMEVPIAMTLLAKVLPPRPNRVANLAAAIFKTLAVAASLLVGTPNVHYLFFASIEMVTTAAIAVLAWRWKA